MWERINRIRVVQENPREGALAAAVGFLMVEITTETATPIAYVGGAFVAGIFLIGLAAPLGGVAGLVIHDLFHGAFGYWTLASGAWILVFAGVVGWLVGSGPRGTDFEQKSIFRLMPAYTRAVIVAGTYATALASWLVLVLGGQRFYTATVGFLPGVAAAIVASVLVVAARAIVQRFVHRSTRTGTTGHSMAGLRARERDSAGGPSAAMTIGVFAIGCAWLGGAAALDLLVHDLKLFATVSAFRAFVTGFLGSGSLLAAVGRTALVSLYRYGELTVRLSTPFAMIALYGWYRYQQLILALTIRRSSVYSGGLADD
jgi:hypothetical protein